MAVNEVFKDGDHLSLPVPTGTLAGTPLRIGVLNAVTQTDEGSVVNDQHRSYGVNQPTGGIGNKPGFASVKLTGVWLLTVTGALSIGQTVYITPAGALTATATGNSVFGIAIRAKASGAGDAVVKIIQSAAPAAA